MSKLIPVGEKICVEPLLEELKSSVLRPETEERKKPQKGRVVAIGSEYKGQIKIGDIIYYQKYGFEYITIDRKEYGVGTLDDVYGILK